MKRLSIRVFACLLFSALFLLPTACTKKKAEAPAPDAAQEQAADAAGDQAAEQADAKPAEDAAAGDAAAGDAAAGDAAAGDAAAADAANKPNMFGGPAYKGAPALDVTAALVKAGGGAENFDFSKALVAMLGEDTVNKEVAKLTKQYGKEEVTTFVNGMTYAIKKGLAIATEKGVTLPAPADLSGAELAKTLVKAGTTEDGTWWSGYLFDKAVSHDIHNAIMDDINQNPDLGPVADKIVHKILNQAMYDVAQALGMTDVKLADLH